MIGGDKLKRMVLKIAEDNPEMIQGLLKKHMVMEMEVKDGVLIIRILYQGLVVSEARTPIKEK